MESKKFRTPSQSATVIVGTQFGDEGKGKLVDYLSDKYDKLRQKDKVQTRRVMESCAAKAKFIVNYSSFSGKGKSELLAHFDHYIC